MVVYVNQNTIRIILNEIEFLNQNNDSEELINEELFSEEQVILCPDVKFIEGMDRLTVKEENRDLYILKFYEFFEL